MASLIATVIVSDCPKVSGAAGVVSERNPAMVALSWYSHPIKIPMTARPLTLTQCISH